MRCIIAWMLVGLMLHACAGCVPVEPHKPIVTFENVVLDGGRQCVVGYAHDTAQAIPFGFTCDPKKVALFQPHPLPDWMPWGAP